MSIKEANRLSIMRQIDKKILSVRKASSELRLSLRQTKRLRRRYLLEGEKGLISKRKGHPSSNRIPRKTRDQVMEILREPLCEDWGPTFAKEKLEAMHGLYVSRETLRCWMIKEGLWKSKKKKERKIYQRRSRRSCFGELIQGDGSHHDWFEGRGDKCALLMFVDDATSKITSGEFFPTETTDGYLKILEKHLKAYRKPSALYVDKHSVFRVNRTGILKSEAETHFGRVLRELDIKLICAHSPQAKGRIERANGTLQDRLVKEMRLRNISSIEEANQFLPEFITEYNQKFGKEPQEKEDAHRSIEGDNLERIFARKTQRKLSKDLTFQYETELFQIETTSPNRIRKTHVEIIEIPGKPLIVEIGGKPYEYKKWRDVATKRAPVLDAKELEGLWSVTIRKKPRKHHPWR